MDVGTTINPDDVRIATALPHELTPEDDARALVLWETGEMDRISGVLHDAGRPEEGTGGVPGPAVVPTRFQDAKSVILESFERAYFGALVRRSGGNVSAMSRESGMTRQHLRSYLGKLGIPARPPVVSVPRPKLPKPGKRQPRQS